MSDEFEYDYDDSDVDDLDGCDKDFNDSTLNTSDDDIAALVLFADVDFEDPDAVDARKAEWESLL